MFDKRYYNYSFVHEDHSREAARILGDKLESISQAEIRSKDRVDITLAEYERLKKNSHDYKELCERYYDLLAKIGIPCELINTIDPDTVSVETCVSPYDFKKHYQVMFTVCEHSMHR